MKDELILNSGITKLQWQKLLEKFFRVTKDNNEKTKDKNIKATNCRS
jgi:hypothetical protein